METRPAVARPGTLQRLGRTVVLLGLVSFFADVSGDLVYPLVPLFLTVTLGAPVAVVGLVEGLADGASNIFKVGSGLLSDRMGRRMPMVTWGYGLAALGKVLLALATHWGVVLAARTGDRMGKGIRGAPRDAMIAQAAPPDIRGAAFGLHRAMDTAGALGGAFLAFLVVSLFSNNLRLAFAVAVVPAFIAVLLTFAVRDMPLPAVAQRERGPRLAGWRRLPRAYWVVLAVMVTFALANSSDAFILLRAKNLGLGISTVVLAYLLFNSVYAALAYPFGRLSDLLGRRRLILVAFAIYAATYLGLALANSAWAVWPLLALYGAYLAIGEGVGRALVADCTPADLRATGMGLYQGAFGVGVLLASLAAGLLWDAVGPQAPFLLGAGLAALALLIGLRYLPGSRAPAAYST